MSSEAQRDAIAKANAILEAVGLAPVPLSDAPTAIPPPSTLSMHGITSKQWKMTPSPARLFSAAEKAAKQHLINKQTTICAIADHDPQTIVEYPQAPTDCREIIAHRFRIDPKHIYHPKYNIQYSLGGSHGKDDNVLCGTLLTDSKGIPVYCEKFRAHCKPQPLWC